VFLPEYRHDVVASDLQRGSSSPDIFEAFDLAQIQMKVSTSISVTKTTLFLQFIRERVKKVEAALEVSESMVIREVTTREAFQKQLLEIRFDKAKAFQELENLKVHLAFLVLYAPFAHSLNYFLLKVNTQS